MSTTYRNVVQMCRDRGYGIIDEKENEIVTDCCRVFFTGDTKINIGYIKDLVYSMVEQGYPHVIVVYNGTVTVNSRAIRDIQNMYRIEFFNEKAFMYSLMSHDMVPKHVRVDPTDRHYAKVRGEMDNLPRILSSDPVVRYYGFSQGDVLRIYRNDNTHAYRLVV